MRVVFVLLIALGAALYFPRSRAVVLDLSAPVLDPVLAWSTRGEMRRIARDLESRSQSGRALPSRGEDFTEWLERSFQGNDSRTDPWGNTYTLRLRPDSFDVVSAGPDGEPGNDDDVIVSGERQGRR